jgi:hypothetical protein
VPGEERGLGSEAMQINYGELLQICIKIMNDLKKAYPDIKDSKEMLRPVLQGNRKSVV